MVIYTRNCYKNDSFSGKCKILYNSGDQYEGEVEKNDKSGNGTYTWSNGAVYIGEWVPPCVSLIPQGGCIIACG